MIDTAEKRGIKMKILEPVSAAFDRVCYILACLSIGLFIFAWLSVCSEIVFRYFFNHPLVWVIEISEYILVFITFLGSAWLLKEERHVSIDIVSAILRPRHEAVLNIITSFLGAISCLAFFWYSGQSTWDHFLRNAYDLKYLRLPFALILAPIPIGSFMLFIQFVKRANRYIEVFKSRKNES